LPWRLFSIIPSLIFIWVIGLVCIEEGERVRLVSRRGAVEAPIRFDEAARPGLAFITPHFSEQVDVNLITNEAWDPQSGTSEFKATAIRLEKLPERQESRVADTGRQQRDFSDMPRVPVAGS